MLKRNLKTGLFASVFTLIALSVSTFTACNRADHNDGEDPDYVAYRSYVVSVRDTSDRYYDKDWTQLESDYSARKARLEAKKDKLDEKSRAEYDQLDKDWNDFKVRYEQRRAEMNKENEAKSEVTTFRARLLSNPNDETLSYISASELLHEYQRFYEAVKLEHGGYSAEQWNTVNSIYNTLKARREALENEISKQDLQDIKKIQVNYESIKIPSKPFAEHENH